jgi:hypothetical protein
MIKWTSCSIHFKAKIRSATFVEFVHCWYIYLRERNGDDKNVIIILLHIIGLHKRGALWNPPDDHFMRSLRSESRSTETLMTALFSHQRILALRITKQVKGKEVMSQDTDGKRIELWTHFAKELTHNKPNVLIASRASLHMQRYIINLFCIEKNKSKCTALTRAENRSWMSGSANSHRTTG